MKRREVLAEAAAAVVVAPAGAVAQGGDAELLARIAAFHAAWPGYKAARTAYFTAARAAWKAHKAAGFSSRLTTPEARARWEAMKAEYDYDRLGDAREAEENRLGVMLAAALATPANTVAGVLAKLQAARMAYVEVFGEDSAGGYRDILATQATENGKPWIALLVEDLERLAG